MGKTYHPYKIALTDGQKNRLRKAFTSKTAVALRVKPGQIGRGDELLLTATQIARLQKLAAAGKGAELQLSQTQIQSTGQRGCNLFSTMLGLALPLIKPALGALASAGLSLGAEKVLKKIFGRGFGPQEIELYKLVQRMSPGQKKAVERYLVGQGFMTGGAAQYGGFLGMLASTGVPLAISLVKKIFGKGLHTQPPRSRPRRTLPPQPRGKEMQIHPPPPHLSSEHGTIIFKKSEVWRQAPLQHWPQKMVRFFGHVWVFRFIRASAAFGMGKRHAGARGKNIFTETTTRSSGNRACGAGITVFSFWTKETKAPASGTFWKCSAAIFVKTSAWSRNIFPEKDMYTMDV